MNHLKAAEIARAEGFVEGISWSAPFNKITAHFLNRCFMYERQKSTRRKRAPRAILFFGDQLLLVEHNAGDGDFDYYSYVSIGAVGLRSMLHRYKREVEK